MKPKTIITVALLVFVVISVTFLVVQESRQESATPGPMTSQAIVAENQASDSVIVSEKSSKEVPDVARESVHGATKMSASKATQVNNRTSASETVSRKASKKVSSAARETVQETTKTSTSKVSQANNEKVSQSVSHKVIAYYFHGTARCPSCRKIEAYSQEAVQNGFPDALKNGLLEWHVVNVEEPGNTHFVKDYQLYTKSLVIVDTRDSKQVRWKNLEKVWELLGDKDGFIKYVQDEVREYLGGTL